jgi:hypothetical protein
LAGSSGVSEFCEGEATAQDLFAIITGEDAGGTWTETSAIGSGVTIGAAMAIDFSGVAPGVYEFTYAHAASASCPAVSSTATITVTDQLLAGTSGVSEFCEGEATAQNLFAVITGEDAGGTWTETSAIGSGVTIGSAMAIDFSGVAPGTYEFTYAHAASASCPAVSSTATITVTDQLLAGTSGVSEFCEGEATAQDLFAIITGEDAGGTWTETSAIGSGVTIGAAMAIDFSGVAPGVYEFTYAHAASASCPAVSSTATITVTDQLLAGTSGVSEFCEGEATAQDLFAIITGEDAGGTWTETSTTGSGVTIGSATAIDFSGVAPGVYEFTYTHAASASCPAVSSTATITVTEQLLAGDDNSDEFCVGSGANYDLTALLSVADAGGDWFQTVGAMVDFSAPASVDFSTSAPGVYTFTYTHGADGSCPADVATFTITIRNPSIGIVKEGIFQDENNDGFAQVGETIFYTFTVTNTGDVDLANVIVTDPLVTVDGDPILALNVGQIDAITFTASYAVQQEDLDNELFANQAFVTSDFPLCGPITDLSDDNSPFENDSTVVILIPEPVVKLLARVRLQGALLGNLTGLMRDDLRAQGFLPATEPYTAILGFDHVANLVDETIIDPATIFADNGDNSIVDWVFIELRSTMDPTLVVTTRSGFVQRDGDIVDLDGISPLCFRQVVEGSYYVAVRHRNHLGTMTGMAITMTEAGTTVDFTDPNIDLWENASAFDGIEQILVNGQYALWAGNTNANQSVVFAGQNNDETPIFNEVNGATGNIFRSQTFVLPGYLFGDVNMDSNSIFAGQNNDVNPIFDNVNGHPVNIFTSQTFVIPEQLAD